MLDNQPTNMGVETASGDSPVSALMAVMAGKHRFLPSLPEMEKFMLELPQSEAPVVHLFGEGICIRSVTLPAGNVAIGNYQKFNHWNIMLKGRVTMDDGTTLEAPLVFLGKPGRKRGFIHEEVTWLNIYATDETDADAVEAHFIEKSEALEAKKEAEFLTRVEAAAGDRIDFEKMIVDLGVTAEQVAHETAYEADRIPMPTGYYKFQFDDSPIHGRGCFASAPYEEGELIGPANIGGYRTPLGWGVNHSANPNAYFKREGSDILMYAKKPIKGQTGGMLGDEITLDYRQARMEALNV